MKLIHGYLKPGKLKLHAGFYFSYVILILFSSRHADSQTINCKLTPLHSLDFFFGDKYDTNVIWPDSIVKEIESSLSDTVENDVALQFLPLAMLEMDHYFKNGITQEAFYRIMRYSKLFAETFNDSSWLINMHNFCPVTDLMIKRFNSWYENDTMMSRLMFTTDRGPYFGDATVLPYISDIYITDSIDFPMPGNRLFAGVYDDSHFIFTKDASGEIKSFFRVFEKYHEEDVKTSFSEVKLIPIPDFGYSLLVFVSDGVARLYFDETGKLRFYFIW